jgi:hypothetical protein
MTNTPAPSLLATTTNTHVAAHWLEPFVALTLELQQLAKQYPPRSASQRHLAQTAKQLTLAVQSQATPHALAQLLPPFEAEILQHQAPQAFINLHVLPFLNDVLPLAQVVPEASPTPIERWVHCAPSTLEEPSEALPRWGHTGWLKEHLCLSHRHLPTHWPNAVLRSLCEYLDTLGWGEDLDDDVAITFLGGLCLGPAYWVMEHAQREGLGYAEEAQVPLQLLAWWGPQHPTLPPAFSAFSQQHAPNSPLATSHQQALAQLAQQVPLSVWAQPHFHAQTNALTQRLQQGLPACSLRQQEWQALAQTLEPANSTHTAPTTLAQGFAAVQEHPAHPVALLNALCAVRLVHNEAWVQAVTQAAQSQTPEAFAQTWPTLAQQRMALHQRVQKDLETARLHRFLATEGI